MQANGLPTYASAHGVECLELRRRIDAQEETIARQAAQLVEYASMLDTERATVAELRVQLAERDAEIAHMIAHMWDGVPVAQLQRQYNIKPMTVHDFGLDAQYVDKWLRSLDGEHD